MSQHRTNHGTNRPQAYSAANPGAEPKAEASAYLRTKVLSARPEELRMMLLEGALKFARQGLDGLESKDFEQSFSGISQCRSIVVELMSNLRDDVAPEVCDRVRAVYTFLFNQLTEASLEKDAQKLEQAIELLEFERETWQMLIDDLAKERAAGRDPVAEAAAKIQTTKAPTAQPQTTGGAPAANATQSVPVPQQADAPRPSISISA
ncbi:MAG: flagellar export chaperone FliS [Planctomycetota bacterium]